MTEGDGVSKMVVSLRTNFFNRTFLILISIQRICFCKCLLLPETKYYALLYFCNMHILTNCWYVVIADVSRVFINLTAAALKKQELSARINPANIRLGEDVLKTSSRRLDQDEYIHLTHTSSEDVFKTSSRRLDQDQYNCLGHTSSRRLQGFA